MEEPLAEATPTTCLEGETQGEGRHDSGYESAEINGGPGKPWTYTEAAMSTKEQRTSSTTVIRNSRKRPTSETTKQEV